MAVRPFAPVNLLFSQYVINSYTVKVPPEYTLDDALKSDSWINVREQLRIDDVITLISMAGLFDVDIRLVNKSASSGALTFKIIREAPKSKMASVVRTIEPAISDERFHVKHGGFGRWSVIEVSTGKAISEGLSKEAAEAEKAELEKQRAAA